MNEFYAFQNEDRGLEAVVRFHSVKRWHMIDTTRNQTLAEHSANVTLLAFYIAKKCPEMFFGPADSVVAAALVHDIAEVFMGDIPTITKPYLDRNALNELENTVMPKVFEVECDEKVKLLVKLCDLADGIRFIRVHGVDTTAQHAQAGLSRQFIDKLADSRRIWPEKVADFVGHSVNFYAYEYR